MKTNLKTKEGRIRDIDELTSNCRTAFVKAGIEFSVESKVEIYKNALFISLTNYSRDISLYSGNIDITINIGCSGEFNPQNKIAYWRAITTASILKNWDVVCRIVNDYCMKYTELCQEIDKQNNV